MRTLVILLTATLTAASLPGATTTRLHAQDSAPSSARTAERIERVERGLLPSMLVQGRSYEPATIEERLAHHGVPSVSVAVVHDGRIEWARAYGLADVASKRPATTGTLYQAASMSKPVAALGALRLVEQGRLALDEPVNEQLTSWQIPATDLSATRPVTLRDLLTHSAGLTVHGFPGYAAGAPVPTTVQVLDGAGPANTDPVRVDVEPGSLWRYSGGGTTVVQLLMSDVTGVPFPELMRRLVLDPLDMDASTYEQPLPDSLADIAATAYRGDGAPVEGRYHTYPEMAAAGLWTTPSDLARYLLAVQRAAAGDPGSALSPELAQAMLTPGVGGWGLGPSLGGQADALRFQHGGANEGFRGQFVGFARRGEGVVVMTNSDRGGALVAEVAQAVAREYDWPGIAPRVITPVALPADQRNDYVGRYSVADGSFEVRVAAAGRGLRLTMPDGQQSGLVPTGTDAFTAIDLGADLRFERDAGEVQVMVVGQTRLTRVR